MFTVDLVENKDWVKLRVSSIFEGYVYNTQCKHQNRYLFPSGLLRFCRY